MRTEFGRLAELLPDADLRDARRATAVGQRLGLMHFLLQHHHEVEDHSIWPFLRAADPAVTELCDDLEADHGVLHGLLDQMVDRERPLRARAGWTARRGWCRELQHRRRCAAAPGSRAAGGGPPAC